MTKHTPWRGWVDGYQEHGRVHLTSPDGDLILGCWQNMQVGAFRYQAYVNGEKLLTPSGRARGFRTKDAARKAVEEERRRLSH